MTKIPLKKYLKTPAPWQVWYAYIPFEDGGIGKRRPVLVVELNGSSCTVLEITSKQPLYAVDVSIIDLNTAGLSQNSVVQIRKARTISKESLGSYLGTLSRDDRNTVKKSIDWWNNSDLKNTYDGMRKVQGLFRS
ncbi:hypothetical protein MmiHf6_09560 [Methanimicrococcus hongohii]|uniref:Type II toxin-antitoxin system PemK/MazF family toxin n=1 Tax=Methanimicrococcus hongohii TaxID=3028295 RepID=A0AA96ZUD0_9EURY|nr:type II toxin-antitoxin system PemK/MazF family toxin [Methanimicrococcus sp. Hf6]WNY23647.1 hypothetical protein MmiHf6_09560 [Methanimicrococcus sp. Hf6]